MPTKPIRQLSRLLADREQVKATLVEAKRANDAAARNRLAVVQTAIRQIQAHLSKASDPELETRYLQLLRERRSLQQICDRATPSADQSLAAEYESLVKSLGLR